MAATSLASLDFKLFGSITCYVNIFIKVLFQTGIHIQSIIIISKHNFTRNPSLNKGNIDPENLVITKCKTLPPFFVIYQKWREEKNKKGSTLLFTSFSRPPFPPLHLAIPLYLAIPSQYAKRNHENIQIIHLNQEKAFCFNRTPVNTIKREYTRVYESCEQGSTGMISRIQVIFFRNN